MEDLRVKLTTKTEECETLTTDLERASDRLSEIDGQTATITEKVTVVSSQSVWLMMDRRLLLLRR